MGWTNKIPDEQNNVEEIEKIKTELFDSKINQPKEEKKVLKIEEPIDIVKVAETVLKMIDNVVLEYWNNPDNQKKIDEICSKYGKNKSVCSMESKRALVKELTE